MQPRAAGVRYSARDCGELSTVLEPLIQDVLNEDTSINRTHFAVPNTLFVYITTLKSGHLTNRDTLFCPKCVHIKGVPLM